MSLIQFVNLIEIYNYKCFKACWLIQNMDFSKKEGPHSLQKLFRKDKKGSKSYKKYYNLTFHLYSDQK